MKLKKPTAALEIPKKLFLLWSTLRRMSHPSFQFLGAVENSLAVEDNVNFSVHSPPNTLEKRLSKQCFKVNRAFQGLRWEPKERLKASSMLMMIYSEEGDMEFVTDNITDENLVPKLHISGKLHNYVWYSCNRTIMQRKRN